ncbi:MAG: sigma-54-dependent transcriptional regulator [Candidatus Zixiibacteriota bacterium]
MTGSGEKERILIVDDAPDTLEVVQRNLVAKGYQVFTAPGVAEAVRLLEKTPVELVITDFKMPGISGLDLVRHIRENLPETEVIMITGYASVTGAVEAVKTGAEEYLAKPFTEEELLGAVRMALDKLHMRLATLSNGKKSKAERFGLIGNSASMKKVLSLIAKAANVPATVLITGESGTGKELVARAIHYNSLRASAPFIPINCGAIPQELFESELFGHVKGAFTGATVSRAGFFQTADGGTIFLDEISEISQPLQVKLLRVLQDKEICMVGASRPHQVDVRIVAATNKDLVELVKKGAFREELYFRLSVLTINLPSLRERGDDKFILINHFLTKYAEEMACPTPVISDNILKILDDYDWPGNVRELENLIQRLIVMSENGKIDISDLPPDMRFSPRKSTGINRPLAEVEAEHIANVLDSVDGNKTKAAEILKIDRKTLREKLKNLRTKKNR